eukprot:gene1086-427_t
MDCEYVRGDSSPLCSLEDRSESSSATSKENRPVGLSTRRCWRENLKRDLCIFLQFFHFLLSMAYLWAGVVEFVRNPPFFDAYGDATASIDLPRGFFQNDPRSTESGILRLMDLPILSILVVYQCVCVWLRYKGLSWFLTANITATFLIFWIVNFWSKKHFEWKHYSSRMNGLGLQVASIALSATTVFMVIFYKRKKFPFKFRSSLSSKQNTWVHIVWNFLATYLVIFSSLMIWFIKLYASWACFNSTVEIMQLCSTTSQVQCYPCSECRSSALRQCVKSDKVQVFSCSSRFPSSAKQGAFCTFNFNMSIYGFLLTFAYIGGLCVFLSTFLRVAGHYLARGMYLAIDYLQRMHFRSTSVKRRFQSPSSNLMTNSRELQCSVNSVNNNADDSVVYSSDSDGEGNVLINAHFG